MHTFFINTAKNKPDHYEALCEIEQETRRIIPLDCPFSLWQDEKSGYRGCVNRIGEIIDNYKDVVSDYSLIVYVDLLEFDLYARQNKDMSLNLAYYGMMPLFKRYIASTMQNALINAGRQPKSTVIVFDEKMRRDEAPGADDTVDRQIGEILFESFGFSFPKEFKETAFATAEEFVAAAEARCKQSDELLVDLTGFYAEKIKESLRISIRDSKTHFEQVAIALKRAVLDEATADGSSDVDIDAVCLSSNRYAGGENTKENARRFLRLYSYLIDCAKNGTHQKNDRNENVVKKIPDLDDQTLEKVCKALFEKQCEYYALYLDTEAAKENFAELKLAPTLYELDCAKFGLNRSGFADKEVVLSTINEKEKKEDVSAEDDGDFSKPVKREIGKRMEIDTVKKQVSSVFEENEFSHFDVYGDNICKLTEEEGEPPVNEKEPADKKEGKAQKKASKKAEKRRKKIKGSPEKMSAAYAGKALSLRHKHASYLEDLKLHLNGILSHYAGKSLGDKPPILKKRVYERETFFADEKTQRELRYAVEAKNSPGKRADGQAEGSFREKYKIETADEESVQNLAKTAYATAEDEYLKFCAGRSVAITDIDSQCAGFLTRLEQIKESLEKIGVVAIGLFVALLAVYLPFILVQWTAITKNALTFAVALASIALPLVILYVIFTVISVLQKKEFERAWMEFKEKSAAALEENALAVTQYDRLLSALIPSLRWIYEYKLDVEQYVTCCRLAKAKRKHHEDKLLERSETVGNLLEDLEYRTERAARPVVDKKRIDYGSAFSAGETNPEFYSILDEKILSIIMREGGR